MRQYLGNVKIFYECYNMIKTMKILQYLGNVKIFYECYNMIKTMKILQYLGNVQIFYECYNMIKKMKILQYLGNVITKKYSLRNNIMLIIKVYCMCTNFIKSTF